MNHDEQARLIWVKMYLDCNDAGLVCRRCGISRPTLRKWVNRYQQHGEIGLIEHSRKPHNSPIRKVTDSMIKTIEEIRSRNLGARRIQSELLRNNDTRLSLATIHNILNKLNAKPLIKAKRYKKFKRYQKSIPGERIQLDTCKI